MVSIIVPVYNERESMGKVIDDLKTTMTDSGYKYEIIVLDDGSTDGTSEIAAAKGVCVIRHDRNRGYGASLKNGIQLSKNEIIVILDGDGSYPVDAIPGLLENIGQYDMVIGSRMKRNMPLLRRLPKYILTKLGSYLVKAQIPDINSGLRAFRKSFYNKYFKLLPDRFSFTLTLTLCGLSNNDKIKFIPIDYNKRRGKSKIRFFYDTLNFFVIIGRTIMYFHPLRIILPIAAIFIISSFILCFYSLFFIGKMMDVTVMLLFISGVQLLFFGLIADLINRRIS